MATFSAHWAERMVDSRGEIVSVPFYFIGDDGDTVSAIVTQIQSDILVINALSGLGLQKAFMVLAIDVTPTAAAAGSMIEQTALMRYSVLDEGFNSHAWAYDIPGPISAIFTPGTKWVDPQNAGVQALNNMFIGDSRPVEYTNPTAQEINAFSYGRMTFRKHRRVANRH